MFKDEQKSPTQDESLSENLLQLYKEFAAFSEYSACFCDSLAGVAGEDEVIDTQTVQGIKRCCQWMKYRMEEFRARLEGIQKKSCLVHLK